MGKLIKIFFIILILIFLVPMVWFLLKELFWFFDITFAGLFVGTDLGWFLLAVIFIVIIIWLLSCD